MTEERTGVLDRLGSWLSPWRVRGREALLDNDPQPKAPIPGQGEHLVETPEDQENGTEGEEEEERHSKEEGEGRDWNLRNATNKQAKRRNLQVYLEETSVTQNDTTPFVEKTIRKTFQVVSKETRVTQQREVESDNDNHIDMGRRNSGRRRSRKGSRGDATSPQVKSPPNEKKTGLSPTSPQEAWAETHLAKGVTTETMTSLEATDSRGVWAESCSREDPESVDDPHTHSNARTHTHSFDFEGPVLATLATVDVDMDEDDDGRVVRKTETPESKRRSVKMSHSKHIFAKKVLVNSEHNPEEEEIEQSGRKWTNDPGANRRHVATVTSMWEAAAPADDRTEEKAMAIRTIVNRIKLFENQGGSFGSLPRPTEPRSADVSPARSVADRIKMLDQNAGHVLLKRSLSAERSDGTRSSSAPPDRPKAKTVRERANNFSRPALNEVCFEEAKAQTVRERAKHFSRPALNEVFSEEAKPPRGRDTQVHRQADSREAAKQPPWALKKAKNPPEPAVTTTSAQCQPVIKGKSVSTVSRVQRATNTPPQPRPKPVEQEKTPVTKPARGSDQPDAAMPGDTPTPHADTLAADAKDISQASLSPADKKSRDTPKDNKSSQSRGSLQTKHNALAENNQSKMTPSDRSHNEDIPQTSDKDSQSRDTGSTTDTSDTKLILKATDSSYGGNRIKNKTAKETSKSSEQKIVSRETTDNLPVKDVKSEDNVQVKDTTTKGTILSNNGSKTKDVVEMKDITQRKDTLTANRGLDNEQVKYSETKPALKAECPEVLKSVENKDHSLQAKDDKMLTHDANNVKGIIQNNDSQQLTGDITTAGKDSKAPRTEDCPTSSSILTPKHCHVDEETQHKDVPQAKGPTKIKDASNVKIAVTSTEHSVNEDKLNIQRSGVTSNKTSTDVRPQKDSVHHKTPEASPGVKNQEAPQRQSSTSDTKQEMTSSKQEVTAGLSSSLANDPVVKRPSVIIAGSSDQNNKTQSTESNPVQLSEPVGQTASSATLVERAKLGKQEHTEAKSQLAEDKKVIEKTKQGNQEHSEAKSQLAEAKKVSEKTNLGDGQHTEAKSLLAEVDTVKVEVNAVSPPASNEQVVSRVEEKSEERKSVPEQLTAAVTEAAMGVLEQSTKTKSAETKAVPEQSTEAPNETKANIQPESPPAINSNSSLALEQGDQPAGVHISRSTYTPKKSRIGQVATEVPDQIKVNSEEPSPVTKEQLSSKGTTDTTKETLQNTVSETSDTIMPSPDIHMTPATPTADIIKAGQETNSRNQSQDVESTTETMTVTNKSGEKDINQAKMPAENLTENSDAKITAGVKPETSSSSLLEKSSKDLTPPGKASGTSTTLSNLAKDKSSSLTSLTNEEPSSLSQGNLGKATPESSAVVDSTRKKNKFSLKGLKLRDFPPPSQDSPSSWLDLDVRPTPKPRQSLRSSKLSVSVTNLDASGEYDPQDFIERVKKLAIPFNMPPRSKLKKSSRMPTPSFAMPAIREDRNEKTFDLDEFKFGLRKRREFSMELSLLHEQKSMEKEAAQEGLRRPHLDRGSILTKSLLLRETEAAKAKDEEGGEGEEKEGGREGKGLLIKSRLEGSSILSSLRTTGRISRLGLLSSRADTGSGPASPSESLSPNSPLARQPSPSDPTQSILDQNHTGPFAAELNQSLTQKQKDLLSQSGSTEVNKNPTDKQRKPQLSNLCKDLGADKKATLDSLHWDSTQIAADSYSSNQPKAPEVNNKLTQPMQSSLTGDQFTPQSDTQISQSELRSASSSTTDIGLQFPSFDDIKFQGYPEKLLPQDHGRSDSLQKSNPEISPTPAQPPEITPTRSLQDQTTILAVNGSHRRPGKMVLFERPQFEGQSYEIFRDAPDATALKFSTDISAKVIRGCWILYEEPGFKGRSIALEEGPVELTNEWAEEGHVPRAAMVIGSIRLAVRDYTPPRIDLFPEMEGRGFPSTYHSETAQLASYGLPQCTASIKVHSGVWLVFSEEHFQGYLSVLEADEYPTPQTWGFPSPAVGSLRPLQMGGLKVENPTEAKALLYERPGLQGACLEISGDLPNVSEGHEATHRPLNPHIRTHTNKDVLKSVGSMKILSGLWVGYEQVGFEGRQYVLEEGEYLDWQDWGGATESLLSLRPVLVDFASPHMKMYSGRDFSDRGVDINLLVAVPNTQLTGYGLTTQSINVLSGVWVLFEGPDFCGQKYVVEKGQYAGPEDWGADNSTIASALPVFLDDLSGSSKFKVELYSEPGLVGSVLVLDDSVASLPPDFTLQSCRVVSGSWLACEHEHYLGSVCVLEEGVYPDVRAMGFLKPSIAVQSLQTTGFEFSLPSIILCERVDLRGRRLVLTAGSVNLQLTGGCSRTQSVMVQGGMWVLYEGVNFRGAQILLRPGTVTDWLKLSGWQRIGSLRPLLQKPVSFRLRNHETGHFLSITGALEDIKLMRIQATDDTGGAEQVWAYQDGHLQCKLLEECCVEVVGSLVRPGARLCVTTERGKPDQLWNITSDGLIRSNTSPDLVVEVKGGQQYDRQHVILSPFSQSKLNQRWSLEFL